MKSKSVVALCLAVTLALVLGITSMAQTPEEKKLKPVSTRTEKKPTDPNKPPIRIAELGGMNFPLCVGGWRAVTIAVDEINETGGLLGGRRIELLGPYNTEARPEEAIKCYEKAVWTDKADFIIDGMLDDSSAACMARVAETDVITLGNWVSTVACYDKVWQDYDKYKNWFGGVANDWGLVEGIADFVENFLKKELGWKSIVIFREDLVWTEGCADFCYEEFPKIGIEVKGDVVFPLDTVDFAPYFDRCVKSGADGMVVFLAAVASVPASQYMKLEIPMAMAGVNTDAAIWEFYKDTGGSDCGAAQWSCFAGKQSEKTLTFMDTYWHRYNTRPRLPEHCGFDGYTNIMVLADAIERAGTIESDAVIKELERSYEIWYDWPWYPGGWFGMKRPPSPDAVPERYRRPAYDPAVDGPWPGHQSVAPHVWSVPELVRWGQWQSRSEVDFSRSKTLQWQKEHFPEDYGIFVCVWPPEFADGEWKLPPWMRKEK